MRYAVDLPSKWIGAVLLLALAGCSRSTVVGTPEHSSFAEDTPVPTTAVRAQSEEEKEPKRFAFPDDAGGVLLAKVLPPKDVETVSLDRPRSPRRSLAVPFDKAPTLPLPPSRGDAVPHLPADGKHATLRPRLVAEETLGVSTAAPALPPTPPMPDKGRIRVPSPDVHRPIPLPILARPVSDRAALDDPTLDASTAAAVAAPIPPRANKAPFRKQTLPDPYEGRRGNVPAPEEAHEFPLGSPQTPRR